MPRPAVRAGAGDYPVKGHVDAHWLPRAPDYMLDRKAAREALLCSEARFRAMSDAAPFGILVSYADGHCVCSSAAYQKIAGPAEQSPEPFVAEVRLLRADGHVAWVRLSAAVTPDGTGVQGHVLPMEDITFRKDADAVLRSAEEALGWSGFTAGPARWSFCSAMMAGATHDPRNGS